MPVSPDTGDNPEYVWKPLYESFVPGSPTMDHTDDTAQSFFEAACDDFFLLLHPRIPHRLPEWETNPAEVLYATIEAWTGVCNLNA